MLHDSVVHHVSFHPLPHSQRGHRDDDVDNVFTCPFFGSSGTLMTACKEELRGQLAAVSFLTSRSLRGTMRYRNSSLKDDTGK